MQLFLLVPLAWHIHGLKFMTYSLLLRIDQWQGRLIFVARADGFGVHLFLFGLALIKRTCVCVCVCVCVSSVSRT
jgi:hypothetical protein